MLFGLGRCEDGFRLKNQGKSSGPQWQLSSSLIYSSHDQRINPPAYSAQEPHKSALTQPFLLPLLYQGSIAPVLEIS